MPAPLKCGHTTRVADSHNRFSRPSICSGTRDQVYLVHHQQYFLPVEAAPRSPPDNSLPVVLQQFGCTCTSMHDAGLYAVLFLRFMIPERDRGTRTLRCGAIAGIPSNKKTCITPHSLLYMTYVFAGELNGYWRDWACLSWTPPKSWRGRPGRRSHRTEDTTTLLYRSRFSLYWGRSSLPLQPRCRLRVGWRHEGNRAIPACI